MKFLDGLTMYISNILKNYEKQIILALSLLAALRIFLFSAAFPFFNDVDEWAHFDLIHKYSRGYLPSKNDDHFDIDAIKLIALYSSPEYTKKPESFRKGKIPQPLWSHDEKYVKRSLERTISQWSASKNHEAFSPPVYYLAAGLWYKAGKLLALDGGTLLYWIRFLNIPIFIGFLYLSYFIATRLFPKNMSMRIGIPLLLTFFPQDTFYAITNDVLSPLLFAISFYLLIEIYLDQYRPPKFYFITGLAVGATFLIKYSNIAIVVLLCLIAFLKIREWHKIASLVKKKINLIALFSGAGLPVFLWFARNYLTTGDMTGSSHNFELARYGIKPFSEIWNHPIFTFKGFLFYWHELMKTFWRGELTWYGTDIASKGSDLFYALSSGLFLILSVAYLFTKKDEESGKVRFTILMSLFVTALSVLFLIIISVTFDFSNSYYPSADYPYHRSGRLISGILTPFLILYITGLSLITDLFKTRTFPLFILLIIGLFITFTEISLTKEVFYSRYNWFHLR